jgi:hypothetical protein
MHGINIKSPSRTKHKVPNHLKVFRPSEQFRAQCGKRSLICCQIFSFLAYRSRLGLISSGRDIREALHLHHGSLTAALNALGALVIGNDAGWRVEAPPAGYFHTRTVVAPKHWTDSLAYTRVSLTDMGRQKRKSHTLWAFLKGRQVDGLIQGFTMAGAAKACGCSAKTVKTHLNNLIAEGVIAWEGKGLRINNVEQPSEKKPATSQPKTPALKGDDWDIVRKDFAADGRINGKGEAIIQAAVAAGYTPSVYQDEFTRLRNTDAENRGKGKASPRANFANYCLSCLQSQLHGQIAASEIQVQALCRPRGATEETVDREEERRKKRLAARANPMDPEFNIRGDYESLIFDRVRWEGKRVDQHLGLGRVFRKLSYPVNEACKGCRTTQEECDKGAELRDDILRHALNRLNHYYGTDKRATPEEFVTAINEQLAAKSLPLIVL